MKKIQLPFVIVSILCAIWGLGCGDDDDTDSDDDTQMTANDGGSGSVDIMGTWKLVSFEPQAAGDGPLPEQTLTINSGGTWSSVTVADVPVLGKFTITAKGTYRISGSKVTGETTEIKMEPDFGVPIPVSSGISGESTVKREGNKMTITSKDETTGQTTATVYEKQ